MTGLGMLHCARRRPAPRSARVAVASLAALGLLVAAAQPASAAGLYFSERGVRALARGGAFTAGADDASSITYNPAGLAFAGRQFLVDGSYVQFEGQFQRRVDVSQSDPNTGLPTGETYTRKYDPVSASSPFLPIPTIVYVDSLGADPKKWNFALGLWAPYAAIATYPEQLPDGSPSPQRYSLLSLEGSAMAVVGAYGAYSISDKVKLGGGVEVLGGTFNTRVAFSACVPDRFLCAPEQPDYDAVSQLEVGPIMAPSGTLGLIVQASETVRLGLSYHLPFWISSGATAAVRLPSAAAFTGAAQDGDTGHVSFELPQVVRTGVEVRPAKNTRLELDYVFENWAAHDAITFTPDGVALTGMQAFPERYELGALTLDRGFQNSHSVRAGLEQHLRASDKATVDARLGAMYETSAVPPSMLSVTTVDMNKFTLALGAGVNVGRWTLDFLYAHIFADAVTVEPNEAGLYPVNPVSANPAPARVPVNAGEYQASANVFGLGLVYHFDPRASASTAPAEGPLDIGKAE